MGTFAKSWSTLKAKLSALSVAPTSAPPQFDTADLEAIAEIQALTTHLVTSGLSIPAAVHSLGFGSAAPAPAPQASAPAIE